MERMTPRTMYFATRLVESALKRMTSGERFAGTREVLALTELQSSAQVKEIPTLWAIVNEIVDMMYN